MSDYNFTITDNDIRTLLKHRLLQQQGDDSLNRKLLDMEAQIVFASGPLIVPPLHKEQEMIRRLQHGITRAAKLKWWFTGLMTVSAVAAAILIIRSYSYSTQAASLPVAPAPGKQPKTVITPVQSGTISAAETPDKEKTSEFSAIPDHNKFQPEQPASVNVASGQNPLSVNDEDVLSGDFSYMPYRNLKHIPLEPGMFMPMTEDEPIMLPPVLPNSAKQFNTTAQYPYKHAQQVPVKKQNTTDKILTDTVFSGITAIEVRSFCDVNVKAAAGDKVTVKGELHYETKGLAIRRADYAIRYEKNGSTLKIVVENKQKHDVLIAGTIDFGGFLNIDVPSKTDVVVRNSSGNISLNGMNGSVCQVESSYGAIKAENISTNINVVSSSGEIMLNTVSGNIQCLGSYGNESFTNITGNLNTACASGNIEVSGILGDIVISASYGNINISHAKGNLSVSASSGNIIIEDVQGKTCKISDSYGNIVATNIQAPLSISSKSGDVHLTRISGNAMVSSSYGKQLLTDITGDVSLSSSSGDITIHTQKGNATISSIYGDVHTTDCAGSMSISAQSGSIYGKNMDISDKLIITTSHGDIKMQLKNDINDLSFDLVSTSGNVKVDKGDVRSDGKNGKLQIQRGKIIVKAYTTSGDQLFE